MTDLPLRNPDAVDFPPFEAEDLRRNLTAYLDTPFEDPSGTRPFVGNDRWGVHAFFDYDGEPIDVGQTNERLPLYRLSGERRARDAGTPRLLARLPGHAGAAAWSR